MSNFATLKSSNTVKKKLQNSLYLNRKKRKEKLISAGS